MKWTIVLAGVLSNTLASALIKVATHSPWEVPSMSNPLSLVSNIPLLVGIAFYVLALGFYAKALTLLPLHVVHPILTSGSIACVAVLSTTVFREQISPLSWLGVLLVVGGVCLLTLSQA